ncbi:MAG: hypothetical protein ACLFTJ_09445 [Halothece sp.]
MNDALDRVRQKKRPTVPSRESEMKSDSTQEQNKTSSNQDSEVSSNQDTETNRSLDTKISRYQDLKTKASTLRLEEKIATELTQLCKEEGISREVVVEAMFLYCQNHPSVLEAVLEEARTRNEERQEISNRKRAQTMMKRFGEETD